ncbi:MAG: DUF1643 domain-containing protein [Thermomicrobiales bacterium]
MGNITSASDNALCGCNSIRHCGAAALRRFAKREGYGGMVIPNLYSFRTKDAKVMMAATDPVGPDNDRVLADVTGTVIAGWVTNATRPA